MSLAYDASGVLDLCEQVFRNDLELDCERDNQRNTVRAKLRIDGTRYTIVCSAMERAQVLHLWAFLPFDVESEEKAMQMLRSKLYMIKQQAHAEKLSDIRGDVKEIAWGSQIRSYVLQPYTMVKDVRTGEETGNAQAVLDGDIDNFISAYLKWLKLGKPDRRVADSE